MDLNRAMIIGRLTADPESRTTPNGVTVASFSVATNFIWSDANGQRQEKVEYHNLVVWRKLAEICAQYLKKGSKVYVEGRLETRSWEGQDGIKRYRTEIIADNLIMLDRATGIVSSENAPRVGNNSNSNTTGFGVTEIPLATEQSSQEEDIKIENIPF